MYWSLTSSLSNLLYACLSLKKPCFGFSVWWATFKVNTRATLTIFTVSICACVVSTWTTYRHVPHTSTSKHAGNADDQSVMAVVKFTLSTWTTYRHMHKYKYIVHDEHVDDVSPHTQVHRFCRMSDLCGARPNNAHHIRGYTVMTTSSTHNFTRHVLFLEKYSWQTRLIEGLVEHSSERAIQKEIDRPYLVTWSLSNWAQSSSQWRHFLG